MAFQMGGAVQISPVWQDGTATDASNVNVALSLTSGTAANEADAYYAKTFSVAAGQTDSFDLGALTKTLFNGSTSLYFGVVKALLLRNLSTTTTFTVGGSPTNRWSGFSSSGTLIVQPDGLVLVTAPRSGLPVGGTSKVFEIVNGDTVYSETGNTTSGQTAVTGMSSTTGLAAGMTVSGTGIPANTKVASVTSSTAIVLSAAATATNTGTSLTIQYPAASLQVIVVGVLD